jgi:uncharacterized protein YraI
MKNLVAAILLGLALLAPDAQAQWAAYTTKDAHLRAGPRVDYPVVAILPAGTEVAVQGCLADYSWCDVIAGDERGWVYAGNIEYLYQNEPVPLLDYGPQIGVVVIPFILGDYWDHYYVGRPWYGDRDVWIRKPRPPLPPRPIRPPRPPAPPPGAVPIPPRHEPLPRPMPAPRPQPPRGIEPGQPRTEPHAPLRPPPQPRVPVRPEGPKSTEH